MIQYDNCDHRFIMFSRAGSVMFSWNVLLPPLLSTFLCACVLAFPAAKASVAISGPVARIYATVLGFVIVFRTNIAFNRYFDGCHHIKGMFTEWRHAVVSLCTFLEVSSARYQAAGDILVVRELDDARARIVHWFSMLTAVVVIKMCGRPDRLRDFNTQLLPRNRAKKPCLELQSSTRSLRAMDFKEAVNMDAEVSKNKTIVLGHITDEEFEVLENANDEVLVIIRWILLEISSLALQEKIIVSPSILSRIYQEISQGQQHFFHGMNITFVPFPFPFAQFLQYALLAFMLVCPFVVLPDLDDPPPGLSHTWPACLVNFFACAGFVALNEIAVELEEPFGDDANDYPALAEQWLFVRTSEDCYFHTTPLEFDCRGFGQVAARHADEVFNGFLRKQNKERAALAKQERRRKEKLLKKAQANSDRASAAAGGAQADEADAPRPRLSCGPNDPPEDYMVTESSSNDSAYAIGDLRRSKTAESNQESNSGKSNGTDTEESKDESEDQKWKNVDAGENEIEEGDTEVSPEESANGTADAKSVLPEEEAALIEALGPTFQALESLVAKSVRALHQLSEARRREAASLCKRSRQWSLSREPPHSLRDGVNGSAVTETLTESKSDDGLQAAMGDAALYIDAIGESARRQQRQTQQLVQEHLRLTSQLHAQIRAVVAPRPGRENFCRARTRALHGASGRATQRQTLHAGPDVSSDVAFDSGGGVDAVLEDQYWSASNSGILKSQA